MKDNLAIGLMTSIVLKDRYMACKNSWLKDFDNTFLFGGDIFDQNLIQLKGVGEDWNSAFLKQQLGLKYMFNYNSNYDWYSISGCDTILFKKNIINSFSSFNKNLDILLGQTYNHYLDIENLNIKLFSGGASFFISNHLMNRIFPLIDEFNQCWLDLHVQNKLPVDYACGDVALAYMIKKYFNIETTHLDGLFSSPPSAYLPENVAPYIEKSSLQYLNSPLSYHYIKPHEMYDVYNNFNK